MWLALLVCAGLLQDPAGGTVVYVGEQADPSAAAASSNEGLLLPVAPRSTPTTPRRSPSS
jgi:hypothetical protein